MVRIVWQCKKNGHNKDTKKSIRNNIYRKETYNAEHDGSVRYCKSMKREEGRMDRN
jgi:hypothetical protein